MKKQTGAFGIHARIEKITKKYIYIYIFLLGFSMPLPCLALEEGECGVRKKKGCAPLIVPWNYRFIKSTLITLQVLIQE